MTGIVDGYDCAHDLSYKPTGATSLLKLQSFDPAKDTPVEILHTIHLGMVKYLVSYTVKIHLKTAHSPNEQQKPLDRLQNRLNGYRSSCAYRRVFRRQLTHCGSFLGRDFKQLIQVLPLAMDEEFVLPTDQYYRSVIPVLKKLGLLSSLVFMREIDSHADTYINDVHQAATEFITDLYQFDLTHNITNPFSYRLKVHLLRHLADDIRRFGCALHFETEKGEQFNKYIRDHIYHTNRQHVSKDIAIKFGKEEVVRHMMNGGSWLDSNGSRVRLGAEARGLVNDNFVENLLGGSRDFMDNYTQQNVAPGVCGVFFLKDGASSTLKRYMIGKARSEGTGIMIDMYSMRRINQQQYTIVTTPTMISIPFEQLDTKIIIDMYVENVDGERIINVSKFGSYWFFSRNMDDIQ